MKNFILKLFLFSFGCFIIMTFEYFISTYYSSYRTPSNNLIFETNEYPYLNETRTISGDLNKESHKTIKYITNSKGSRSIINDNIEVVLMGDSFSELNNLDQDNTIQGNLNNNFKKRTVTVRIKQELNQFNKFVDFLSENYNKPKTVVLIIVERNIGSFIFNMTDKINFKDKLPYSFVYSSFLKFINEGIDFPSLRFLKYYFLKNEIIPVVIDNKRFLQGENIKLFSNKELKQFETSVVNLNNQFNESNINFIVSVVPNKETFYKNIFKNITDKNMISVDSILRKNNILNINLNQEFKGLSNIYDENDTHLSEEGAKLVSTVLDKKIDSLQE